MRACLLCILACLGFVCLCLVSPSAGETDPFDLLDGLSKARTEQTGFWAQWKKNATFRARVRPFLYWVEAPEPAQDDSDFLGGDGRLEVRTFAATARHRFDLASWLEYGTQKDTYSQQGYRLGTAPQRRRRWLEIDEVAWTMSLGAFDVLVGKKKWELGFSPLYSPASRHQPLDLNDPLDAKGYGIWQASIAYYRGAASLRLGVFPFFAPPKIPGPGSRWLLGGEGAQADFQFFDQDRALGGQIGDDPPRGADEFQFMAQLKNTFGGWDIFVAAFHGPTQYPVLHGRLSPTGTPLLSRQYVDANLLSGGFSTARGRFEIHGEGLVQLTAQGRDDDFFAWVGGFTYTAADLGHSLGLERLEIGADYAREHILRRQRRGGYLDSSSLVRLGQDDVLLRLYGELNPGTSVEGFAGFALDDGGGYLAPQLAWRLQSGLWLKVRLDFLYGPQDSFYGRWRKNRRLATLVEYSF
jgi:hypothetical protein